MLENIRIVLINTFHPGNIGAAARAMKNMGLSQLYLVDPRVFPDEEADSRAAGAKDLLEKAVVVGTMDEAISDCQLVIGTSARNRTFDLPIFDAHDCAKKIVGEAKLGKVAIVFGRETMGLHNSELQKCNYHVYIPANPEYPVLNVSAAIQLVCYEIWQAHNKQDYEEHEQPYPLTRDMELFYEHLENALRGTNFIIPQHQGKVMDKLRRYFNRSRPERTELNMLRGILTSIDETIAKTVTSETDNKGSES
ncbi:MAG: tRNA (cytosine(32)/uridine(32)-2'-O)-methyltransferase TrmJ [Amphritea sp.]|uniref:tRNA (cytosine(32)/uridine(32)-2'-O)-methyltransferase TrmJ n=1 Tax=Amphritea sp. TaxID=1872502 RepID=UPI001B6E24C1|nr:tRNA (cytosine(32)/uridine(32)-2'-O)-methyltransferase TrmJ [Amphritea sp.]MBQ0756457.1 tRNA (cytosine(32)/uridine(32)-2'-O)-methyltransferase TrmJ [Amphritea sp.]MBQ0783734.1 tRNA (cytosine(32)/uridine(32)-2'-O)-methyltransferase TrmJ [Amphritea sp.]